MIKTELEKMLAGELYTATDPELRRMSNRAKQLFSLYNQTDHTAEEAKNKILRKLLGKMGNHILINAPFYCDYGCHIAVGNNLFINYNCTILDCARVVIGNDVMLGPNVQIYTAYHPLNPAERIKGPELAAPIHIGDKVWLGGGVIVCSGVHIGDNTTIGAGSVVTKDIPPDVFAAGNPCRIIKTL